MSDKSELLLKPKRFYKSAAAAPVEQGFAIQLDGRTPKSPARKPLVAPTQALGAMIAAEWEAQVEYIDNSLMPATRLAFTAIDRIAETRAEVAREITAYAASDHLCYRAESPRVLVERQEREWGAVLDWARAEHGLVFTPVAGIIHAPQPPETLASVEALALTLDDFALAGVAFAAGLFGSTVLGLAVRAGQLAGQQALDLSRLDEIYQAEQWGEDAEAKARAEALAVEAAMIDRWFAALRH
ncbi:ATP12 family chaperone protein [Caulobacter sp. SL161]|uniref:ATP12 family chaperone protein n=1 Tax=Caulobacter sp. SL161 TaxID=2995156 RepID=UPI0022750FA5|nr:ATP12 family chaperone protein [Caulobacter sp. SL161]MCY1647943.1 ATP12 family chaperone protein [Caulobacter sp. SL161]